MDYLIVTVYTAAIKKQVLDRCQGLQLNGSFKKGSEKPVNLYISRRSSKNIRPERLYVSGLLYLLSFLFAGCSEPLIGLTSWSADAWTKQPSFARWASEDKSVRGAVTVSRGEPFVGGRIVAYRLNVRV